LFREEDEDQGLFAATEELMARAKTQEKSKDKIKEKMAPLRIQRKFKYELKLV
jgi:hypothetical protein